MSAFYVPGVAPTDFAKGDVVEIKVSFVFSPPKFEGSKAKY